MKVRDLMTKDPKRCGLDTNLAVAARLMWEYDCGALPVVQDDKVVGMITDRDICIALGTRNRPASEVRVWEVEAHDIETCHADDDIRLAMEAMRRARVHRIPVTGIHGSLEGIITLNDLILAAEPKGRLDYKDVMNTAKTINEHPAKTVVLTEAEYLEEAVVL